MSHDACMRGFVHFSIMQVPLTDENISTCTHRYPWDPSKIPENPMQGPNVWPSVEDGDQLGAEWRQTLIDFYFEMVCRQMMSSLGGLRSKRYI